MAAVGPKVVRRNKCAACFRVREPDKGLSVGVSIAYGVLLSETTQRRADLQIKFQLSSML